MSTFQRSGQFNNDDGQSNNSLSRMIEVLAQRWSSMATREKQMVSAAALVIATTVIYLLLIEPAYLGRKKLQGELPILRAQLGQVESLGSEVRRLAAVPAGSDNPVALKGLIEQSASAAGLKAQLSQVVQTGDLIEARFKTVGFAQLVAWIDSASRETRMRVVDAAFIKEGSEGNVSGKVVFEVPRKAGASGS